MKLSSDYIGYTIDGEQILVCMNSRKFAGVIKLNKTAAFIVEQLKNECSKADLVKAITEHYSTVNPTLVEKDIESVISTLISVGAIVQ